MRKSSQNEYPDLIFIKKCNTIQNLIVLIPKSSLITPTRHARTAKEIHDKTTLLPILLLALLFAFLLTFFRRHHLLLFLLRAPRRPTRRTANKIVTSVAVRHALLVVGSAGLRGCGFQSLGCSRGGCWSWLGEVFSGGFERGFGGCEVG
jgi:hypothetical protein